MIYLSPYKFLSIKTRTLDRVMGVNSWLPAAHGFFCLVVGLSLKVLFICLLVMYSSSGGGYFTCFMMLRTFSFITLIHTYINLLIWIDFPLHILLSYHEVHKMLEWLYRLQLKCIIVPSKDKLHPASIYTNSTLQKTTRRSQLNNIKNIKTKRTT